MEIFFENPGLSHIGQEILKSLDIKTLISCRQVCKSMNKEIEVLASKISLEYLENMLERYTSTKSMTVEEHEMWHKYLINIFDHSQNGGLKSNLFIKLYLKLFFKRKMRRRSPFFEFVYHGNVKMVQFNLYHNNFHGKNYSAIHNSRQDLQTAMSLAIQNNQLEIVKSLSQITYEMGALNTRGNTPIHEAAKEGRLEIVRFLSTAKPDPHILNLFGKSAMDLARENGHSDIVAYLNKFPCSLKRKKNRLKAVVPHPWFEGCPCNISFQKIII